MVSILLLKIATFRSAARVQVEVSRADSLVVAIEISLPRSQLRAPKLLFRYGRHRFHHEKLDELLRVHSLMYQLTITGESLSLIKSTLI